MIFGQDAAIDEVASAIKLSRSGLRSPDKPIGNFLFAGPTGVGKTELARQLARILGIEFIRYDMSEYMEKHAVSRLIGAPPGYVGYEEGGLLIDAIRKSPHAVLLLDEIEKAHPGHVQHPAAGDGSRDADRLARPQGRLPPRHPDHDDQRRRARPVRPPHWASARPGKGGSSRGALERTFTPEFRNRLDATVTFNALGTAEIERVVDKQIDELRAMVAPKGVTIELDPAARAWLAAKGFDRAFGARPMARLIERVDQEAALGGAAVRIARCWRRRSASSWRTTRSRVDGFQLPSGRRRHSSMACLCLSIRREYPRSAAARRDAVRRRPVSPVRALVRTGA